MTKVLLSHPPRLASHNSSRAMVWVRKNLFSSWSNSLLTIGCIWSVSYTHLTLPTN